MGMVWVPKVRESMEEVSTDPYLVRVSIKMARKGVPLFNALISLKIFVLFLFAFFIL